MNNNNKAFTLIELIVSLIILVIIGGVGFFSFLSYLSTARDLSRVMEFKNIESSMSSFVLKTGFYPTPTDPVEIFYSGGLVWTQGTYTNETSNTIGYSTDITDPLTKDLYTYSVKNSGREFSLAGVLEKSQDIALNTGFMGNTYAAASGSVVGTAIVGGNYNGELLSVNNGSTNYVLALPSIISSDISSNNLTDILNNNKLVYNSFQNLPSSYTSELYNLDANLDFSANSLVVFSGSISKLKQSYNQVVLLQNLFNAYSGSILGKDISVAKIDSVELFAPEPSSMINSLACDLINFKLKYFVECGGVDFITFFVVNVLHIDISNLPGNKITAVFQASDGTFLFGTNQGIALFDGTDWIVYDKQNSDLVHNQISSIAEDNSGNYWIGTNNGISMLDIGISLTDTSDDIWVTYDNSILSNTHIQYIYTDDNGTIWIGTNNGVTSYNGDIWTDYTKKTDGLTHNNITAIYTDSINNVWFGTNSQGVDKYELLTGDITNYNNGALPDHRVNYIFEDNNNNIWVGTQGGVGMTTDYGITWNSFTTSEGLPDNNITYLFEDLVGDIWVGTQGGLAKYNGSSWVTYDTPDLLGSHIYSIFEDEFGNILILSEGGLDTIDSSGNIVT
ncbi:MAG: two-component regulator propeller domain-containing protein [Candidatus Gracilibacteria bacterium]